MGLLNAFQWQGSGKVYSLPWLKNRLEYSSDPGRIAEYGKAPFTRSRFVMKMLTEFHLSRNSIVVSDDIHPARLRRISRTHIPQEEDIPNIARDVMERVFSNLGSGKGEQRIHISDRLIRELYRVMLENMLGVTILKPLDDYITRTKFPQGSRPMVLEGVMYSFRLHLPILRPIRYMIDRLFFKKTLYMKRVSDTLVQMVCDFTISKPDSLFSTLVELRVSGKITRAQFRGEINSMLVSSFSLASALGSALLCLAARPQYQKKIHDDPAFAKQFTMEVLRLYPPFRQFGYEKITQEGVSCPFGSAGHEFMISVPALHRNSNVWKNPHKFYPERFLDPREMGGLKYLPFGMGKRACLGRRFSMSMIEQALRFVCSDENQISLVKRSTLPRGRSGHLVSFALDDTLAYRAR